MLGLLLVRTAWAGSDEIPFDITGGPLAGALNDFAVQAQISIGYSDVDFRSARSNALKGRYERDDALRRLLEGTGFEAVASGRDTFRIRRAAAPAGPAPVVEEISVTATKRAGPARLAPYSISIARGDEMAGLGVHNVHDLTEVMAALTATDYGPGHDKFAIRGLSDGAIAGHSQSMVGVYLDEARLTDNSPDPALRLTDIAQVELIRGPQGTLYGAGSLGGLVRIVTNKPVLDAVEARIGVSAAATQSGSPSAGVDAMANIPIIEDQLAIRPVFYAVEAGGYIDETQLHRKDVNFVDTRGARLGIRWRPLDRWTADLAATDQSTSAADTQYGQAGLGRFRRANFLAEPQHDRFQQASLTVEGILQGAKLVSSTAFTRRLNSGQLDATRAWAGLTGYPRGDAPFEQSRDIQSFSHESRLSASDDDVDWLAGIFVSHRQERYRSILSGPDNLRRTVIARTEFRKDRLNEAALFGEAEWHFAPAFSLTGGLRGFLSGIYAKADVEGLAPAANPFAADGNDSSGVVPKFVLSFHPQDHLLLYASVAEGFRLGGVNINSPIGAINIRTRRRNGNPNARAFDSDRLWTYEAGAKSALFDGRLKVEAAAFVNDWRNIQTDQVLRDGSLFTSNVGNARSVGFEASVSLQATERLSFAGDFFWNDDVLSEANPLLVKSSGRLPLVPNPTLGLSTRYSFIQDGAWRAAIALRFAYFGPSLLDFDVATSPRMGAYGSADLRLEAAHGDLSGALYVTNLFDRAANTFSFGNPFAQSQIREVTPLRPRTIGVELTWTLR